MTAERSLVLVVEDEPAIADVIAIYLRKGGFEVQIVPDGQSALEIAGARRPDAIVLDIGLPGIDGLEVCRRLRGSGDWTPILFVTARDDEVDRVVGLELGADDYITKPFSPRELAARVAAVLRRSAGHRDDVEQLVVGAVSMDLRGRRVTADGRGVDLTPTEFDLLAYLMRHPGWVFSRDQLLAEVWNYPSGIGTRTVDVHVAQVRAKLGGASPLRTVRGVGYSADPRRSERDGP